MWEISDYIKQLFISIIANQKLQIKNIKITKLIKLILTFLITTVFTSVSDLYAQYSSPESVTYDSIGKRYLVSNTSGQKISQRSRTGDVTDFVTVGGSIHGVTVHDNKVYVCNGTRIKGYDLTNAAEIFNVTLSGSTFLNDLAADENGMLYVTDFTNRRIYKVNTLNGEWWIYVASTTNTPNGIYVDAVRNRLLVCCWGSNAPVKSVNLADSSISNIITTPYGNCDGISLDKYDNVYISTWSAQSVVRYDINFSGPAFNVVSGLSNPADIYVNKATDTLAVPNASNNTVTFHLIDYPSGVNSNQTGIPNSAELYQNYPNPFNPETVIRFDLRESKFISLKIFDILGNEITSLLNEKKNSGNYEVKFDGSNLSGGVYFYRLIADGISVDTKSMILLK